MKQAQIYSQIFIYVLTIILTSFILVYGYNAVQDFRSRADTISCLKFRNDIKNSIDSMSSDFGSVKKKDFQLCKNYNEVCFVETFGKPVLPANVDPVIKDSVLSNAGTNLFLVDNIAKESFYAGNISVNPNVLCIKAREQKITLRLEGKGNHVLVSEWA